MPAASQLNSPLFIAIPREVDDKIPKELRPYFADIYNAIYQFQLAMVKYAGIAPADPSFWSQETPDQTILVQNMNRLYVPSSEPIAAGAMVNLFNSAGILTARNANATNNTKAAHAYCNTSNGIPTGEFGEVIIAQGLCPFITGLTPGTRYFLSTTNALITNVEPAAAGNIGQFVGIALSATLLYFNTNFQFVQH